MSIKEQFIQSGKKRVRYLTAGDSGGSGPAAILIHGIGASSDIWMYNIESLSKKLRVFVPDLPGFGLSSPPDLPFSLLTYAHFLEDFMNTLNIEKADIVGQSLGGGIAIQFAQRYPEKVERLVLVGSAGLGKEVIWTFKAMSLPVIGELFSLPGRLGVEIFFKLAVHDSRLIKPEFVDLYYRYFSQPGFGRYMLKVVRTLINLHGVRGQAIDSLLENLHQIKKPTLIIWGNRDRVLPLHHARFGRDQIEGSRVRIFQDCGHLPFFENVEEFNKIVGEFLGS